MILHWVYPVGVVAVPVLVDPQGFGFDPVAFVPEEAEAVVDPVFYFHHSDPDPIAEVWIVAGFASAEAFAGSVHNCTSHLYLRGQAV